MRGEGKKGVYSKIHFRKLYLIYFQLVETNFGPNFETGGRPKVGVKYVIGSPLTRLSARDSS